MPGPLGQPMRNFRRERLTAFAPDAPPAWLETVRMAVQALALWQRWCAGRPTPDRADIDATAMPALLPHVFLLDVLDDDFRFRLIGEAVNVRYGHRLKGRTLRQLLTGEALEETLHEHFLCSRDLRGVLVRHGLDAATPGDVKVYTRLLLPLEAIGGRACHLFGIMEFQVAEIPAPGDRRGEPAQPFRRS